VQLPARAASVAVEVPQPTSSSDRSKKGSAAADKKAAAAAANTASAQHQPGSSRHDASPSSGVAGATAGAGGADALTPPRFQNSGRVSAAANLPAVRWLCAASTLPARPAVTPALSSLLPSPLVSELCVVQSQLCLELAAGAHADAAAVLAPPPTGGVGGSSASSLRDLKGGVAASSNPSIERPRSAASVAGGSGGASDDAKSVGGGSVMGSRTALVPAASAQPHDKGGSAGATGWAAHGTAMASTLPAALRDDLVATAARFAAAAASALIPPSLVPDTARAPVAAAPEAAPPLVSSPGRPRAMTAGGGGGSSQARAPSPSPPLSGRASSPQPPPAAPSGSALSQSGSQASLTHSSSSAALGSQPQPPQPSACCASCIRAAAAAAALQRSSCAEALGYRRDAAVAAAEALAILLPGADRVLVDEDIIGTAIAAAAATPGAAAAGSSSSSSSGGDAPCASASPLCGGAATLRLLCRARTASLLLSQGDSPGSLAAVQAGLEEAQALHDPAATARLSLGLAELAVRAGRPAIAMNTLSALLATLLRGISAVATNEAEAASAAAEVLGPTDPDALLAAIAATLRLQTEVPDFALDTAPFPRLAACAQPACVSALSSTSSAQKVVDDLLSPVAASVTAASPSERARLRLEWLVFAEAVARASCVRAGIDVRYLDTGAEALLAHGGLGGAHVRLHCDTVHAQSPLGWLRYFRYELASEILAAATMSGDKPALVDARAAAAGFSARKASQAVLACLHSDSTRPPEATSSALAAVAMALRLQHALVESREVAQFSCLLRAEWFARAALAAAPASTAAALAAAEVLSAVLTDGLRRRAEFGDETQEAISLASLPPAAPPATALADILACQLAAVAASTVLWRFDGGWVYEPAAASAAPAAAGGAAAAPATAPSALAAPAPAIAPAKKDAKQGAAEAAMAQAAALRHGDLHPAVAADLDSLVSATLSGALPLVAAPVVTVPAASGSHGPGKEGGKGGSSASTATHATPAPAPAAATVVAPLAPPSAAVKAGYALAVRAAVQPVLLSSPAWQVQLWAASSVLSDVAIAPLVPGFSAQPAEPASDILGCAAVLDITSALHRSGAPELRLCRLQEGALGGEGGALLLSAGFLMHPLPAAPPAPTGKDTAPPQDATVDAAAGARQLGVAGHNTAASQSPVGAGDVFLSASPAIEDGERLLVRITWVASMAALAPLSDAEAALMGKAAFTAATGTSAAAAAAAAAVAAAAASSTTHHRIYLLEFCALRSEWKTLQRAVASVSTRRAAARPSASGGTGGSMPVVQMSNRADAVTVLQMFLTAICGSAVSMSAGEAAISAYAQVQQDRAATVAAAAAKCAADADASRSGAGAAASKSGPGSVSGKSGNAPSSTASPSHGKAAPQTASSTPSSITGGGAGAVAAPTTASPASGAGPAGGLTSAAVSAAAAAVSTSLDGVVSALTALLAPPLVVGRCVASRTRSGPLSDLLSLAVTPETGALPLQPS
jgi:hypothetical protein